MGLVEGFAEYALSDESENVVTQKDYMSFQFKFLLIVVLIKLAMVYVVSQFLWPKIVPKVFSGAKANPGFMNLVGLVFIYYLLF
tara:strand:+ start:29 stop:280 length:252 start_codon:yes stop_codon:yes gene_type:complete